MANKLVAREKGIKGKGRPTKGYFTEAGKRVPNVTTILGEWGSKRGLMYWYWRNGADGKPFDGASDDAIQAGSIAHDLVEGHLCKRQVFVPEGVPAEIMTAARNGEEAFLRWNRGVGLSAVQTELPLVYEGPDCPPYGGTIDCVALDRDGDFCLCDWKLASGSYESHFLQLAAYAQLWEANNPETIKHFYSLRFGKGDPEIDDLGGDFHHKSMTRQQADKLIEGWNHIRSAYEINKLAKRLAK